ncbi:putative cell survival pathways protein [Serendipita sp. 405]|nr:putative cell survival pathways protein [Serendipita sp. 405]
MLVHAIQGMRPNLIATRWNFCWFSGTLPIDGKETTVSSIMMEFTTTDSHGRKKGGEGGVTVNVGCLSVGSHVAATAETKWPDEAAGSSVPVISRAIHYDSVRDKDTGYDQPQKIGFSWEGPLAADPHQKLSGDLLLDVGFGEQSKGLIEKVDVLAEIPKVLKAIVNATGTKPYIYQWMQPDVILRLRGPEGVLHGQSEIDIKGTAYVEASYVS